MAISQREKFVFKNTLVCLLKALENKYTTVELRNEITVNGMITTVDAQMNLTMKGVRLTPVNGKDLHFQDFFVQGSMIRFVHIPDYMDIRKAIEGEVYQTQRHAAKVLSDKLKTNAKRMERRRKFQEREDRKNIPQS